jgi:Caspase domain
MSDDYAIVVGIDNYPSLPKLTSTRNDIALFTEWLKKPAPAGGGITDPSRIKIITTPEKQPSDPFDAEPVQKQIDKALRDFGIMNGHLIGRRLYFYFSGHGIGVEFNDVAMLMANASENLLNSNIGLNSYLSFFHRQVLFEEIVFFVDCCRDRTPRSFKGNEPLFVLPNAISPAPIEDFVFLASTHGNQSFAIPNTQGFMTQALLEGLNGKAVNQKGAVTSSTLADYVPKRVEELAKDNNVEQRPKVERPPSREIVFCRFERTKVQITADPGITGDLILRDGKFNEIGRQPAQAATIATPWEVLLADSDIPYLIENTTSGILLKLELSKIKDKNNVFQFSIPK